MPYWNRLTGETEYEDKDKCVICGKKAESYLCKSCARDWDVQLFDNNILVKGKK